VQSGAATTTADRVLPARSFTSVGARWVAPSSVDGDRLGGVLVVDPAARAPRFAFYRSGTVSTRGDVVTVQPAGAEPLRGATKPVSAPLFRADWFTQLFLRDFRVLTRDFAALLASSAARFFFACFALLFLVTASFVLLRLTRWPLANVLLFVLAVRVYLLLHHLLSVDLGPAVARIVADPLLAALAPSAAFIVLGVVLLLVDVLFIPADRWIGEAGQ
jgi:hypothetical protein